MNKKYFLFAISILSCIILASCSSGEKQVVNNITIDKPAKVEKSKDKKVKETNTEETEKTEEDTSASQETDTSHSEEDNEKEETAKEDKPIDLVEEELQINGNIDERSNEIANIVSQLHSFDQPTNERFDKLNHRLNQHGVILEDNVKGPYGLYDYSSGQHPDIVMAGLSNGYDVKKIDSGYEIVVRSRVGISQYVDSLQHTSSAIKSILRKSDYKSSEKEVIYHLNVSDDRNSATLTRVSDQWW